jgi:hypothetical protein
MASVPKYFRADLHVVLLSMHLDCLDCLASPYRMSDCNDGNMTLDYACDFTIQGSRRFNLISSQLISLLFHHT